MGRETGPPQAEKEGGRMCRGDGATLLPSLKNACQFVLSMETIAAQFSAISSCFSVLKRLGFLKAAPQTYL